MTSQSVPASGWLTTGDVARMLERTPRGARWIADQQHLVCQWTRSGQRLFREREVLRLAERRAAARLRGVTVLRPKLLGVFGEPHQLSLFGPKLAVGTDRAGQKVSLPGAEVHHADSFNKNR